MRSQSSYFCTNSWHISCHGRDFVMEFTSKTSKIEECGRDARGLLCGWILPMSELRRGMLGVTPNFWVHVGTKTVLLPAKRVPGWDQERFTPNLSRKTGSFSQLARLVALVVQKTKYLGRCALCSRLLDIAFLSCFCLKIRAPTPNFMRQKLALMP